MLIAAVVVNLAFASTATEPIAPGDTVRLEMGAKELDGRVYAPHAARVRVWVGPGDGRMRGEWTNVLTHGDSAGRPIHRWVTTGMSITATGDTIRWQLRQTYDAITLQPYGIVRTANNGTSSALRIDGRKVSGKRRTTPDGPLQDVNYEVERMGYVASASDLVPAAVGFKPGLVIIAPVWGPPMPNAEMRVFTVVGQQDVNVEGQVVRDVWKVDEHRQSDRKLLATWYLLDKSPYMVYGEVPLADGSIQRMTEIELPMPKQ